MKEERVYRRFNLGLQNEYRRLTKRWLMGFPYFLNLSTEQPLAENSHTWRNFLAAFGQIHKLKLGDTILVICSSCIHCKQKRNSQQIHLVKI